MKKYDPIKTPITLVFLQYSGSVYKCLPAMLTVVSNTSRMTVGDVGGQHKYLNRGKMCLIWRA